MDQFLSYSRTDVDQVDRLREELERAGHSVWWDLRDTDLGVGKMWQDEMLAAVSASYAFIWCVSESFVRRGRSWVYPELAEAIRQQQQLPPEGIFILPVRLSDCEIPDIRIDSMHTTRGLQRFDYFDRRRNIAGLVGALDAARQQATGRSNPSGPPSIRPDSLFSWLTIRQ